MVDSGFATQVTKEQLQSILTDANPAPEKTTPTPGTGNLASRDDHVHPRLSSATIVTINASNEATVTFTRTFTARPVVIPTLIESADNQPVVFKVKNYTQDAQNNYTGCVIKAYRSQTLPAMGSVTLLGTLTGMLSSYNVFGGSVAGAEVSCFAIQPSA